MRFETLSSVIDIPARLLKLFVDDLFSGLFFCFHGYEGSSSALVVESYYIIIKALNQKPAFCKHFQYHSLCLQISKVIM